MVGVGTKTLHRNNIDTVLRVTSSEVVALGDTEDGRQPENKGDEH